MKTQKAFGFSETINYNAPCQLEKTRKLPDGRFEACAAIFFMGKRGLTVYSVANTRGKAKSQAVAATETQSALKAMLADGRVSQQAAT